MIDFQNAVFVALKETEFSNYENLITPILISDEEVLGTYKSIRDGIVFTNKRIIAINIQGMTGKKKDMTSLPFSKIQCFSVETAGTFDLDSELDLWFSSVGKVRFEFKKGTDVAKLCRMISSYIL